MRPEPYEGAKLDRLQAATAEITARYPQPQSALLPLLHLVQSEDGYVSPEGIGYCAQVMGMTTAEVSAVATFYSQFKRHPNGDYTVGVCTNPLCAIMGGDAIFERLSEHLGVGHDETTADGKITLERIECNAACDHAPVVMVNWEFFDNQTPASSTELVDRIRADEPVSPTRGADRVCTFKEMSRVLAGFPDGRADEGVSASEPTLVGLRLAQQAGWRAPEAASGGPKGQQPVPPEPGGEQSSVDTPAAPPEGGTADTGTGRDPGKA